MKNQAVTTSGENSIPRATPYGGGTTASTVNSIRFTILLRNWSYITEERDIADIRMQKQANDNL